MRGRASFLQFRENGLYVVPTVLQHLVADLPALTVPNLVLGQQHLQDADPLAHVLGLAGLLLEKESQHADRDAHAQKYVSVELHGFIRMGRSATRHSPVQP